MLATTLCPPQDLYLKSIVSGARKQATIVLTMNKIVLFGAVLALVLLVCHAQDEEAAKLAAVASAQPASEVQVLCRAPMMFATAKAFGVWFLSSIFSHGLVGFHAGYLLRTFPRGMD